MKDVFDMSGVERAAALLVDGVDNVNLHLASRNRPGVKLMDSRSLNTYEVLAHDWIVASEPALKSLAEVQP